jgi:hypothetical protein
LGLVYIIELGRRVLDRGDLELVALLVSIFRRVSERFGSASAASSSP